MLRQSQTRRLSELEDLAFKILREQGIKFPYQTIKLQKFIKRNSLKLREDKKLIGEYKTSDDIIQNFVNDVMPYAS